MAAAAVVLACGCLGDGDSARPAGRTTSSSVRSEGVMVRGRATLDDASFDATWLGAAVRKDGLLTPCQLTLPPVSNGRYEIPVMSASQAYGCGAPGAEIVLWTYAHDKQYFSTRTVAWPGDGHTATFDASFATATPDGAAGPRTEFAGEIFDREGRRLPDGTRVDAYVGDTLCGVASVRTYDDFTGFSLTVVGPTAIAGCTQGATLHFRVGGQRALNTAVNDFQTDPSFDLYLP